MTKTHKDLRMEMDSDFITKTVSKRKKIHLANDYKLTSTDFNILSRYIHENYGILLSVKKHTLLESRLQKRLRQLKITSFQDYIELLVSDKKDNQEVINMIDLISTNKTSFFRENHHFIFLEQYLINKFKKKKIRIWSAACSSGEEAYSIAITINRFNEDANNKIQYNVLGTDISTSMLKKANRAIYSDKDISEIPLTIRNGYFLKSKNKEKRLVKLEKRIRDRVNFQRHNLISKDFPYSEPFDVIFCRNALIYFDKATQIAVLKNLYNSLDNGGVLFLGHSESIIGIDVPFKKLAHTTYMKL